jgi:hypothetical protein
MICRNGQIKGVVWTNFSENVVHCRKVKVREMQGKCGRVKERQGGGNCKVNVAE